MKKPILTVTVFTLLGIGLIPSSSLFQESSEPLAEHIIVHEQIFHHHEELMNQPAIQVVQTRDESLFTVIINGKEQALLREPIVDGKELLVPLRMLNEVVGASVRYSTQHITFTKGTSVVELSFHEPIAIVNGKSVDVSMQPIFKEGLPMVPLKFVMEQFGGTVTHTHKKERTTFTAKTNDYKEPIVSPKPQPQPTPTSTQPKPSDLPQTPPPPTPQTPAEPNQLVAQYISPEGIKFSSYSKEWDQSELQDLYQFIKKHPTGKEIEYLGSVVVNGDGGAAAGAFHASWEQDANTGEVVRLRPDRAIELFNGDELKEPKDMYLTLSHEYGHLFTFYWLIEKEGKLPSDPTTGWATLRSLDTHKSIGWNKPNHEVSHFWNPAEIIADEFMVLFAPKEAKERLQYSKEMGIYNLSYASAIENQMIPAAEEEKGLREYWLNLSGTKAVIPPAIQTPQLLSLEAKPHEVLTTHPVYTIQFQPSTTDSVRQAKMKYFVRFSNESNDSGNFQFADSDSVTGENTIVHGPIQEESGYRIPGTPKGNMFVRIYAYDTETKQLTYSASNWYDFSDPFNPKPIDDQFQ